MPVRRMPRACAGRRPGGVENAPWSVLTRDEAVLLISELVVRGMVGDDMGLLGIVVHRVVLMHWIDKLVYHALAM